MLDSLRKSAAEFFYRRLRPARHQRGVFGLDPMSKAVPSRNAAFALFEDWASDIPGVGLGKARLFDDHRIRWLGQQLGSFKGKRILELGPLEGGHTYMMARDGAASILAIEANKRAFLRCLIVKNALGFDADFRCGSFDAYLPTCIDRFDFVLAVGVLYHLPDPVETLVNIARVTDAIGIWTHYYDADVVGRDPRFDPVPTAHNFGNRAFETYRHHYRRDLLSPMFFGGVETTSQWLTRASLLALLDELGFAITINEDGGDHPAGPQITLYAHRVARSGGSMS